MTSSVFKKTAVLILAGVFLSIAACSDDSSDSSESGEREFEYTLEEKGGLTLVTPKESNIVIDLGGGIKLNKSFYPRFNNNPSPEPVEEDYFFLYRPGSSENGNSAGKLLINFMGGGACWENENCLEHRTNYTWNTLKSIAENPELFYQVQKGIVWNENDDNPFKDWTLVFLPYTTGDIHWGSNDQTYTDEDGNPVVVHHRGHDNFLAALRFLKETHPPDAVEKVFVTGQSAGAYGAVFNFPYVREVYKEAKAYCLGDGGVGATTESFKTAAFDHWKAPENVCEWVTGVDTAAFRKMSLGDFYQTLAEYYPECRFGQYTTQYDHNQRFFYYLMTQIKDVSKWNYMNQDGFFVPDEISCEWTGIMLRNLEPALTLDNYNVYVAPGEVHTITTSEDMYDVSADGEPFVRWLRRMVNDDPEWNDVKCDETGNSCDRPETLDSPAGLVCQGLSVFPVAGREMVTGKFNQTEGLAFNSDGRLFVGSDAGIYEVFTDGSVKPVTDAFDQPLGMAPGPEDKLYVCDFGPTSFLDGSFDNDGKIMLLSPDGTFSEWGSGIPDPNFVTVGKDGRLLVSDDFGDTIYEIPKDGGRAAEWCAGIDAPNGMAFSKDGKTLFVAQTFPEKGVIDAFDSRVWSISLTGADREPGRIRLLATLDENAANDGVAVDNNGFLYVAANVSGKLFRIDPADGSATLIAKDLPFIASLAFGRGRFSRRSIYATQLLGGNIWEIPVGVEGAALY